MPGVPADGLRGGARAGIAAGMSAASSAWLGPGVVGDHDRGQREEKEQAAAGFQRTAKLPVGAGMGRFPARGLLLRARGWLWRGVAAAGLAVPPMLGANGARAGAAVCGSQNPSL